MTMRKIITAFLLTLFLLDGAVANASRENDTSAPDTVTASQAFVNLPASRLELLTPAMRLDLVDYYRADSIYSVKNAMEGLSHLIRPLTGNYLKVQITPVTTLTLKLLPLKKGGHILATSYTIGDSLQSADSDLRFFSDKFKEIKRSKIIHDIRVEDFIDFKELKGSEKKDLLDYIPFPTVEYQFSPDNYTLTAILTAEGFLSKEAYEKMKPYLIPKRQYGWDGKKYKLVKID